MSDAASNNVLVSEKMHFAHLRFAKWINPLPGLLILQRNVKAWCTLRTWPWFKLYGAVKPLLRTGKEAEELEKVNDKIKALEEDLAKSEGARKELEGQVANLVEEKNSLFTNLEKEKAALSESEEKSNKLQSLKNDLDR